jgi:hypothetical protein
VTAVKSDAGNRTRLGAVELDANVTALSAMTGFCGTALPNIVIGVCAQAMTAGNKLRRRQEDLSPQGQHFRIAERWRMDTIFFGCHAVTPVPRGSTGRISELSAKVNHKN